jgi:hypothetical protein
MRRASPFHRISGASQPDMTCMAVHDFAPLIAVGSSKKHYIQVIAPHSPLRAVALAAVSSIQHLCVVSRGVPSCPVACGFAMRLRLVCCRVSHTRTCVFFPPFVGLPILQTISLSTGAFLQRLSYHEGGFSSQRLGALSCLSFHPHSLLLAAGANDNLVAVFEGRSGGK